MFRLFAFNNRQRFFILIPNIPMYRVYLLCSKKYDKYYIGYTKHLPLRFWQHNFLSKDSFTSKYRPWEIVISVPCTSESMAVRLERLLKKQKSKAFFNRWLRERARPIIPVISFHSSAG
jgi:putative endonuclease